MTLTIIFDSLCAACLRIGPQIPNPAVRRDFYITALVCGVIAVGALIWRMV